MKMKNLLIGGMSLALVACISVGATLAYLTDQSNTMKNTFTVGPGYVTGTALTLDETAMKDGKNPTVISSENRTEEDQKYAPMSIGDVIAKDPTFHVAANSASSYVFAKVKGVDGLTAQKFVVSDTDPAAETPATVSKLSASWTKVANLDGSKENLTATLDGYYRYNSVVATDTKNETTLPALFKSVVLPTSVTGMPNLGKDGMSIDVAGAIIQSENLDESTALTEVLKLKGFGTVSSAEG